MLSNECISYLSIPNALFGPATNLLGNDIANQPTSADECYLVDHRKILAPLFLTIRSIILLNLNGSCEVKATFLDIV